MYIELDERFGSCHVPAITVDKNPFLLYKTAVHLVEKHIIDNQYILF